ncbi:hypothetical protein Dacet_1760 [Denitrovibrio acetiphilus DSM 12809]|uniref:Transglutaminase-like domain-containing protein n=1 Tax=Denitrovibrio acetiphilus (strain DSM 12809 / NBRC 114555 / N2460) TaxID=522772 RepID=D4H0L1_DENA2|nr:hypothetical protein [Denitrovibrio acetiphilus]ADD68524.1 hypothetical protein Dacet_1760 [Denitrovibrio acetiphilus DSM 12809]
MEHKYWLTALLVSTSVFSVFALSFDDYLKQEMSAYNSYLEEIDREFSSFLKQKWESYDGKPPVALLDKPKPVEIPVAKPDVKPEPVVIKPKPAPKPVEEPVSVGEPRKEPEKDIVKEPVPVPPVVKEPAPVVPLPVAPQPQTPAVKEPAPAYEPSKEAKGLGLSFYGRELDIPTDKKLVTAVGKPLSSKNIAAWWEAVASSNYKPTLNYMQSQAQEMNLGDWGYVNLVERFAAKLLGDIPERKMLVWFFMNKAGYNAKLGYTDEGTVKVMVPSDKELYGVSYYTFSGVRYYVVDVFGTKQTTEALYTYKGKYPEADKPVRLEKMLYPKLGFAGFSRDLSFTVDGKEHKITTIANRYSIAYLNNFPQADLSVYTSAKTPEWIDKTLLPELKKLIEGKNAKESVDIILHFVQTAFQYKTDDAQFGREKFLFTEETVFYPYSDCEDRSVLFAYLIKNLLELDIVMLDFPGHIAAAIDLGEYNTGTMLEYNGKHYSVTDPTYINATAGMVMPQYKDTSPVIIDPDI